MTSSSLLRLPAELRRHIYQLVGIGSHAQSDGLELVVLENWRIPNTLKLNSEITYDVLKCFPNLCFGVHVRWPPGRGPEPHDYLSDEVLVWLEDMARNGKGIWRLQVVAPPLLQFRWTCGPTGIGVKQLDLSDLQMPDEIYYQAKLPDCGLSYEVVRLTATHGVIRELLTSLQGECQTGFQLKHIQLIAEAAYRFETELKDMMKAKDVVDDRPPAFGLFAMSSLTTWDERSCKSHGTLDACLNFTIPHFSHFTLHNLNSQFAHCNTSVIEEASQSIMASASKKKKKLSALYPWLKPVPVLDLGCGTSFLNLPVEIRFMIYDLINDKLHQSVTHPLSSWRPSPLLLAHPTIAHELLSQFNKRVFHMSEQHLQPVDFRAGLTHMDNHAFSKASLELLEARWMPQLKQVRFTAPGLCTLIFRVTGIDGGNLHITVGKVSEPSSARDVARMNRYDRKDFKYATMRIAFREKLHKQLQTSITKRGGYGLTITELRMILVAAKDFHDLIEEKDKVVIEAEASEETSADLMATWMASSQGSATSSGSQQATASVNSAATLSNAPSVPSHPPVNFHLRRNNNPMTIQQALQASGISSAIPIMRQQVHQNLSRNPPAQSATYVPPQLRNGINQGLAQAPTSAPLSSHSQQLAYQLNLLRAQRQMVALNAQLAARNNSATSNSNANQPQSTTAQVTPQQAQQSGGSAKKKAHVVDLTNDDVIVIDDD
ncbi:hypothetical protein BDZ85DRAFT_293575 [Elsinoe ampelina]|uniref:Uncharacterized protein n=1 Tax=Elsinoe ampelina TaxID=302913 RepID=A0A6A6GM73_9PEZI|nr:hypothetical protein BDZ85DRAFT_293575 [Elsinoe ampelina]